MADWNMFLNLYFCFLLVKICDSKQGEVDQSLMSNIYQNIWQNSANIMSNAKGMAASANGMSPNANGMGPNTNGMGSNSNGMGTQLDRNCFISGMQMSGLNPIQPQMAQSNIMACPCITYDLNGCPKCQCINNKEATEHPIKNVPFEDKQSTEVTADKVTDIVNTLKEMSTTKTTTTISQAYRTNIDTKRQMTQTTTKTTTTAKAMITTTNVTTDKLSTTIKTSFTPGTTEMVFGRTTMSDRFSRHSADDQVTQVYSKTKVAKSTSETTHRNVNEIATERTFKSLPIFEEKSFSTSIGLGVALLFMTVVAVVFITLWRRTSQLLRREQNELYFTEKSFRNDSLTSINVNDLTGSKFAINGINGRPPELPLRTPPLTPTAPPVLTSTPVDVTRVGQTSFKLPPDDNDYKHDYLELI